MENYNLTNYVFKYTDIHFDTQYAFITLKDNVNISNVENELSKSYNQKIKLKKANTFIHTKLERK